MKDQTKIYYLREILLVSTLTYVLGLILSRIVIIGWQSIFMYSYGVNFKYLITEIEFPPYYGGPWTEYRIYEVFGTATFLGVFSGLLFLFLGNRYLKRHWINDLFILWFSFHFFVAIVAETAYSPFRMEGIGYMLRWIFRDSIVRLIFASFLMILWLLTTKFWVFRFVLSSPRYSLIKDPDDRKDFAITTITYSWLFGSILALIVFFPVFRLYEFVYIIIASIVTLTAPQFARGIIAIPDINGTYRGPEYLGIFTRRTIYFILFIMVSRIILKLVQHF